MANDDGPVAAIVGIGFIAVALFAFFAINNAFNNTPQFHSLPPSQQSEIQTIQSVGAQALTTSGAIDPLEIFAVVLASIGGIAGLIIALLKRK